MSPSPASLKDETKLNQYGKSWGNLLNAVRQGTSWSGHEQNRCFLNLAGKKFADSSTPSGLNFHDDGRAMAVCDWNRDGKLDLWLRNRSAPRLRLMINQGAENRALSFRLQGTKSNRDGIGAIVEMTIDGKPTIRSLRAGEMFLSQSSKWIHFGLGDQKTPTEVTVYWPGGISEKFRTLETTGRFLLKQGTGIAKKLSTPTSIAIAQSPPALPNVQIRPTSTRLPVALPLPRLTYQSSDSKPRQLKATGQPQLLMIWESSCEFCARDLRLLEAQKNTLSKAGIELLALSADDFSNQKATQQTITETKFSGTWGIATPASLLNLWKWQAAWFDRRPTASVPFAYLLDGRGYCLTLYRDGINLEVILNDLRELNGLLPRDRWHLAPPLNGTWFTHPLSPQFIWNSIRSKMREN
ncbi:MAG: ASPIC/UnbV domain-containing protein [Akkermansiaceae bacterium]